METYSIKSRIWIENEQGIFLGEGRIKLLKAIEKQGSLSKAAKSMGMSYKKAWNLVDAINKSATQPMVTKATGGYGGGGTKLTQFGLEKITQFEAMKKRCWDFIEQETKAFNNE